MEKKVHYEGLTDAEVLESRKKYGANVLTCLLYTSPRPRD